MLCAPLTVLHKYVGGKNSFFKVIFSSKKKNWLGLYYIFFIIYRLSTRMSLERLLSQMNFKDDNLENPV